MPNYSNNSYSNLIELTKHVADSWATNHPNYTTSFTTPAQLLALSSQFRETRLQSGLKKSSKRENTERLSIANKAIEDATTMLRRLIKALYPKQKNYDHIFGMYGLESESSKSKTNTDVPADSTTPAATITDANASDTSTPKAKKKPRKTFQLPVDNDDRIAAIEVLLNKLREPNNLIAPQAYGLQAWESMYDEHKEAWSESKSIKSSRTVPVRATAEQSEELKSILSRLRMQISVDFFGANINQVYREFGFLNEL